MNSRYEWEDTDWADFRCKTCKAQYNIQTLTQGQPVRIKVGESSDLGFECGVCGSLYLANGVGSLADNLRRYNKSYTAYGDYDRKQQSGSLCSTEVVQEWLKPGSWMRSEEQSYLAFLYAALSVAQRTVHFVTYGWPSNEIVGALKMLTHMHFGLVVRGVVSCPSGTQGKGYLFSSGASDRNTNLRIRKVDAESKWGGNLPHQKIVVIDNSYALFGSANLTSTAYAKVGKGMEHLQVEADPVKVMSLHNRLFSPAWLKASCRLPSDPWLHWLTGTEYDPGLYLAGAHHSGLSINSIKKSGLDVSVLRPGEGGS